MRTLSPLARLVLCHAEAMERLLVDLAEGRAVVIINPNLERELNALLLNLAKDDPIKH